MVSFPEIKGTNDEKEFTQMIKAIKVRHNNVVPMMALGVQQLKKGLGPKIVYEDLDEIHQFLDRFYMSRIGIRMLIGQLFIIYCFLNLPLYVPRIFVLCPGLRLNFILCLNSYDAQDSMLSCTIPTPLLIVWVIFIQRCLHLR